MVKWLSGIYEMEIIYTTNVSTVAYEPKLMVTIDAVNRMFSCPPIFVASNGIDCFSQPITTNVHLKKWGSNQGWQLGALNGILQSLRFAAESVDSPSCPILTSHEDTYPVNKQKIASLIKLLDEYDFVCRRYVGTAHVISPSDDYPYCVISDMIFSPRILKLFRDIEPVMELHPNRCAEEMFGHIAMNMGLKSMFIPIPQDREMTETDVGFFHNHKH